MWGLESAKFEESVRHPSGDMEKAVRKMNIRSLGDRARVKM